MLNDSKFVAIIVLCTIMAIALLVSMVRDVLSFGKQREYEIQNESYGEDAENQNDIPTNLNDIIVSDSDNSNDK